MAVWSEIFISDCVRESRLDSDFYKPEFIKNHKILVNIDSIYINKFVEDVKCGPFGSTLKCETYLTDGVIVARPFNINNFQFEIDNIVFISEDDRIKKGLYLYEEGDIFFSRVGDIRVGIVPQISKQVTISPNIIALKLKQNSIDPYYATVFFNTEFGQKQIFRGLKIVAQPTISTTDISRFLIYLPTPEKMIEIGNLLREAISRKKQSKDLYSQAQTVLEKELGLDKIGFLKSNNYSANFNEVINNNRSDADYYQTKYRQLESHLTSLNTKSLAEIGTFGKGIEVGSLNYREKGKLFIRVSNINNKEVSSSGSDKYISESLFNKLKNLQPTPGDLLLTKDGSPGICCNITEEVDGIISSGIVKLKLLDDEIPNEYFGLVVNSKICQMQIERDCSGALILHWKPEQIRKLKIPILDKNLMKELAELVSKSKEAQKESKSLLSSSIKQVEDLIEAEAAKN